MTLCWRPDQKNTLAAVVVIHASIRPPPTPVVCHRMNCVRGFCALRSVNSVAAALVGALRGFRGAKVLSGNDPAFRGASLVLRATVDAEPMDDPRDRTLPLHPISNKTAANDGAEAASRRAQPCVNPSFRDYFFLSQTRVQVSAAGVVHASKHPPPAQLFFVTG